MELTYLALIVFVAGACGAAGLALAARDLAAGAAPARRTPLLGRLPAHSLSPASQSPLARFDHWFQWLIAESGWGLSPMTAALLMAACGLAIGGAVFLCFDQPPQAALCGGLGVLLPLPLLMRARRLRMQQLQEQLPDLLELLSRAVRAGESIDQAVDLAGRKGCEPLAVEFRRVAQQLQMGLSLPAAMRSLASRVRTSEMRIFTAAVSVHRQAGGNLALTLERMSHVVRERLAYRRQLRATTAAGRFSASMISLAGPSLFLYLFVFQHEYVAKLLNQSLGQTLLAIAVLLQVVGLVWISRMLKE